MRARSRGTWLTSLALGLIVAVGLAACGVATPSGAPADGNASTGPVTISTNLTTYTINDAVGVTISNKSATDYFANSGKSACTIIQLERYNSGRRAWEPLDACLSQDGVQTFAIAHQSQQQFTLAPTSSADPNAWQAGLYRVIVMYSANADGASNAQQAHCVAFTIR